MLGIWGCFLTFKGPQDSNRWMCLPPFHGRSMLRDRWNLAVHLKKMPSPRPNLQVVLGVWFLVEWITRNLFFHRLIWGCQHFVWTMSGVPWLHIPECRGCLSAPKRSWIKLLWGWTILLIWNVPQVWLPNPVCVAKKKKCYQGSFYYYA